MKRDNKIKPELYKDNINPNNAIIGEFITQVSLSSDIKQPGVNMALSANKKPNKNVADENLNNYPAKM